MSTQKTDVRDARRKHLDALCNEPVDMSHTPRTDACRLKEMNGCIATYLGAEIVRADDMRRIEEDLAAKYITVKWRDYRISKLETELIAKTEDYEAFQSEALKTITALTAERDEAQERVMHLNAELKRANEWHPASEPPDNGRLVLLMIGKNMYIGGYDHDENMWRDSDVTHWRELPAPPKGKDEL
jgi:hypothetical protein